MLTDQEKQFLIEILVQVSLNHNASQTRNVIISKLQLPPEPDKVFEEEITPPTPD